MLSLLVFSKIAIGNNSGSEIELTNFDLTIENVRSERGGQVIIFVFKKTGYPKKHNMAIARYVISPTASKIKTRIEVPKNIQFALKVLHDENSDGKVTKNWTGFIPKEGLGFSNKQRIRLGPPKYNKSKISYKQQPHTIVLRY